MSIFSAFLEEQQGGGRRSTLGRSFLAGPLIACWRGVCPLLIDFFRYFLPARGAPSGGGIGVSDADGRDGWRGVHGVARGSGCSQGKGIRAVYYTEIYTFVHIFFGRFGGFFEGEVLSIWPRARQTDVSSCRGGGCGMPKACRVYGYFCPVMRERYGSSSCCCAAPAIFRMELGEVVNVSRKNQRGHPRLRWTYSGDLPRPSPEALGRATRNHPGPAFFGISRA